jgi:hypothetical protein
MNKWLKIGLVGLLVVGVMATTAALISGAALAQEETPTTPENRLAFAPDRGFGWRMGGQEGLEAAANALGMTSEELQAALWAGKTLADIAEEKGVDLVQLQTTVQEAVKAARVTAIRAAIEQALQDGTITQANADWLLQGLDSGFIPGFGFGGGRGGMRGRGFGGEFFGAPPVAPETSPSSSG